MSTYGDFHAQVTENIFNKNIEENTPKSKEKDAYQHARVPTKRR